MIREISQNERLDVLLALALAFERKIGAPSAAAAEEDGDSIEQPQKAVSLVEKSLAALKAEDFEMARERAAIFDDLAAENQQIWQTFWLDKIRRRGRSLRLDQKVNPSQIVEILKNEPETIQLLILKNLPSDLSRQIAENLGVKIDSAKGGAHQIAEEILALVRHQFLSNFVGLEDVYEPNELDKFSVDTLAEFVRRLGVRETAIACRGINSKESLAAFLNRFNERDAKEIVNHITEMEKIKPFWVAEADRLVRGTLEAVDFQTDELLKNLGLRLLAMAYAERDETAQRYTAQKMTVEESVEWLEYIRENKQILMADNEDERQRFEQRRREVERLAVKFEWSDSL